ncbi:HRDC domain-containing protein [Ornithinibacillus halophilus]|uniref:HRDC domain-containing protein n=1 Tax=Ornithinibacillus halophilus TaxID=930117 RepID=A0A1M5MXB5_9BACI|nr:HRDC domain-containing protein [Ornithinibacillus halophilus]SHG81964.1 HRDC domain-containing protein [Ornithinibacillus halophilus]
MSFLKNVFNILTENRDIKEPIIYKGFNEDSPWITNLTRLVENNEPNIDLQKVENHLKLFSIGQAGEKNVLFELQNSMLPMVVLHDVSLEYEDYYAQLDFVIITHKFIMVLEVKKLFGSIHITDKGEFQRVITKNNKVVNKEGMYSPINQVERHVAILKKLLKANGIIQSCPVKYAVTFANPKTILNISKNTPANIQSSVIRHDQIKAFIKDELEKKSPVLMTDQKLYDIADTILKFSKEKEFNIENYILDPQQQNTTNTKSADKVHNNDSELRKSLSEYRLSRSKELKIKPYYIFTNKILDSLLETKPLTNEELLEIEGIGHKKVGEFGEDIISIIKGNYTKDTQIQKRVAKDEAINQSKKISREELKSSLTAFRNRRSQELNVKPYYIFTNNTLESILDKRPSNLNELLGIEGIGPKKANEFGQEILSILKGNIVN